MRAVGRAAGVEARAGQVAAELMALVEVVALRSAEVPRRPRVTLLEWLDPPFSSGHWNPALVRLAGGTELLGEV